MRLLSLLPAILSLSATVGWADTVSDEFTVFNPGGGIYEQVGVMENGTLFGVNAACFGVCSGLPCPPPVPAAPSCTGESPLNIYYINDPAAPDPAQFGKPTNVIDARGFPDDITGIANIAGASGTVLRLAFTSMPENFPPVVPNPLPNPLPPGNVLETGPIDMTSYLNPALQSAGYTATFFSNSDVPEPASVGLLGGLMLAGLLIRNRRSKSGHAA